MKSVTVIDYGAGNLHSVVKALREVGAEAVVTGNPDEVSRAERLVLPGVGAFGDGMAGLHRRGLDAAIISYVQLGRPLLGICLGMQMLMSESEEFGTTRGLGIITGGVVAIPPRPTLKVPHVGWSAIEPLPGRDWAGSILAETPQASRVYFVHSFTAAPVVEADRLADTYYGGFRISAAVKRGNVTGCQFHPEKSGLTGLAMLTRFLNQ